MNYSVLISFIDARSLFPFGFSKDSLQRREETRKEREIDEDKFYHREVEGGTTGSRSIDIVLIQHLLHCEFLLQHLQVFVKCTCNKEHKYIHQGQASPLMNPEKFRIQLGFKPKT